MATTKRILTQKQIYEGQVIPKWYGIAYVKHDTDMAICYPIPINLIIRVARDVYLALAHGIWTSRWEQLLYAEYNRGVSDGTRIGRRIEKDLWEIWNNAGRPTQ